MQEHRFTITRIANALRDLGLDFAGFDPVEPATAIRYRARFSDDPDMRSLANWSDFEQDHPDTFAGMYQFWASKRSTPARERGQQ